MRQRLARADALTAVVRAVNANLEPEKIADAIIGGPTGQSIAPRQLGPTLLASATNKGKFVVRLDAPASARGWTGRVVEMDASLADDLKQQANVKRYLAELDRRNFAATDTGLAPRLPAALPPDYQIAGNASCRSCHAADCAGWDGSKHAKAWPTLLERTRQIRFSPSRASP